MAQGLTPIRRVVTGQDARGRSRIVWDGPAPNIHDYAAQKTPHGSGRGWTDLWVFDECPAPLSGDSDDGNKSYPFPAAATGAHLRIVQYQAPRPGYDAAQDPDVVPPHAPKKRAVGQTWDRGGRDSFSSGIHKTESVDYGILMEGERTLILDDRELLMRPGDVVVQLGNWHGWRAATDCRMAFVMIGASYDAGSPAAAGHPPITPAKVPEGVKPVRRIVTVANANDKSTAISDGGAPEVRTDPARPGFASACIWVTDATPAPIKGIHETLHLPHTLEPPARGSVCRVVTLPPDEVWKRRVGAREVRAYFEAMGSPGASTYSTQAPHPYMQKTRTLEFCLVLEGEITLVLDTGDLRLNAGDVVVQRGTNHAWSNLSGRPAVVAISSHDAR